MQTQAEPAPIRLIHFSDIHVTVEKLGWKPADFLNKRLPGWLNMRYLGRGKHFARAPQIMRRFVKDVFDQRPDGIIFCGDATGLGFEAELAYSGELLQELFHSGIPAMAVPG